MQATQDVREQSSGAPSASVAACREISSCRSTLSEVDLRVHLQDLTFLMGRKVKSWRASNHCTITQPNASHAITL